MTGMQSHWGEGNTGILLIQTNNNHNYTLYALVLTSKMYHASRFSLGSDKNCH